MYIKPINRNFYSLETKKGPSCLILRLYKCIRKLREYVLQKTKYKYTYCFRRYANKKRCLTSCCTSRALFANNANLINYEADSFFLLFVFLTRVRLQLSLSSVKFYSPITPRNVLWEVETYIVWRQYDISDEEVHDCIEDDGGQQPAEQRLSQAATIALLQIGQV